MKITLSKSNGNHGSVLLVTLGLCVILGILMGGYLSLVNAQRLSVARAQCWNHALVLAEAGVEEAMAHMNSGLSIGSLGANSWVAAGGSTYVKTNSNLANGVSYVATIIATNTSNPVIRSTGYVPGPYSTIALSRTVQVSTKTLSKPSTRGPWTVINTLNMNGASVTTDSFDSTKTNLFPGGLYNSTNAMDHGDLWSLSSSATAISVDNGKVNGSVHTGAGGGVSININGANTGRVGDKAWVSSSSNKGIQPGHQFADANYTLDPVTLPADQIWLTPTAGDYTRVDPNTGLTIHYKYILSDNSYPYVINNLSGGIWVTASHVVLKLTGTVSFGGGGAGANDAIYLYDPYGDVQTDLTIYADPAPNTTVTFGGNGVVNATGVSKNFKYRGLPSNTAMKLSANAAVVGDIYAPNADFTLSGGGNNTYDFIGQAVSKSGTVSGKFNFHYDEAPTGVTTTGGYAVASWDEP
jgi:Tfp pilus assembly protein PilX